MCSSEKVETQKSIDPLFLYCTLSFDFVNYIFPTNISSQFLTDALIEQIHDSLQI